MATATAPAAPAAPAPVSIRNVIPGFAAFGEFHGPRPWDMCAVNAEMMALAVCPWDATPLTGAVQIAWKNDYVAARQWTFDRTTGLPSGGTTLAAIHWHLTQKRKAHIVHYIPYSSAPDLSAIHQALKDAGVAGNPVILQVVRAYHLRNNEAGIQSHFVTVGGIDSESGYWIGNGDTTDALAHKQSDTSIPCYWNGWGTNILPAAPRGLIVLDRHWVDPRTRQEGQETAAALREVSEAIGNLQTAVTALSTLQKLLGG